MDHLRDYGDGALSRQQIAAEVARIVIVKGPVGVFLILNHSARSCMLVRTLPGSVAVDVKRSGHQDHDHRPDGFALSIKVVVAQKFQFFLGHKQLLSRDTGNKLPSQTTNASV